MALVSSYWNFIIIGLFLLPVWPNLSTPFFILSIIFGIISLFIYDKLDLSKIRRKWFLLSYPLIIVLMIVSLSYTKDIEYGVKLIERCLPLFFFPLILIFIEVKRQIIKRIFHALILGILLSFLLNLIGAIDNSLLIVNGAFIFDASIEGGWSFYESFEHGGSHFIGGEFSKNVHPSYISLYTLCSIIFLIGTMYRRCLKLWIIFFLLVYLFLLASRAALIILFILFVVYLIKANRKYVVSFMLVILVGVFLILNPRIQNLYHGIINFNKKENFNYTTSEQSRILIYKSAIDLISDSFLFGYGVGDADEKLLIHYKNNKYMNNAKFKYNAHNQFFQTSLQVGLLGVILLCIPFFYFYNKRLNDISAVYYLLVLFSSLLFESMLVRYNGIIFYSIIVPLILNENLRKGLSESRLK